MSATSLLTPTEFEGQLRRYLFERSEEGRAVRERECDVVLLDVHLGHDETHGLLALLRGRGVPVVLVTGSSDADVYRDRADAVLTKPFEPQELVKVARRLARVEA